MTKLAEIAHLVPPGCVAQSTRRAHRYSVKLCLAWDADRGACDIDRGWLSAWKHHLASTNLARRTCNGHLTNIRSLLLHAFDLGYIELEVAVAAKRVGQFPIRGVRRGTWLTREQCQALLGSPDPTTLRGLMARALIAVMLGAGLRRGECVKLQTDQLVRLEGRWVIKDLTSKGGRTRTVPVGDWAARIVRRWLRVTGVDRGPLFRRIDKEDTCTEDPVTGAIVYQAVKEHGREVGLEISPTDLRRTFAQLAYSAGAPLDQLSLTLGHTRLQTTEIYLGLEQDLRNAPADVFTLGPDGD